VSAVDVTSCDMKLRLCSAAAGLVRCPEAGVWALQHRVVNFLLVAVPQPVGMIPRLHRHALLWLNYVRESR
jgi:hypothetical protein